MVDAAVIKAIAGEWNNSPAFDGLVADVLLECRTAAVLCCSADNKRWNIRNNSSNEKLEEVAKDAVAIAMGRGVNNAMTYILKNDSYIGLMYKLHAELTHGNESYIRYCTADGLLQIFNKAPAKPESLRCMLTVWCRNGGITAGGSALCVLFGVFAAGLLGASPITWTGIGVSLLTVLFSFAFSGAMHLVYRRVVSTPDRA